MRFISIADSLYDGALAILYPQACAVCGALVESRFDGAACAVCWRETHVFSGDETLCWKCGAVLARQNSVTEEHRMAVRCHACDEESFTAARAVGEYEKALRASVLALKKEPHVPARVARLLLAAQNRAPLNETTLIVPVPLHEKRRHERGFNQADGLARTLAKQTGLRCDEKSLVRGTYTALHRAGMDARMRRESVREAFVVRRPRLIKGEKVLLIDDVFTTGATASACSIALKEAGADAVFVLTLARPVK